MTNLLDLMRRVGEHAGGTASAMGILLRVTVLLSTAILVALALRRSSAALRHMLWTLSLAGTLLIPLCYWAFPAWQWAVLPPRPATPSTASVAAAPSSPSSAEVTDKVNDPAAIPLRSAYPFSASAGESVALSRTAPVTATAPPAAPLAPESTWSWPLLLAAVWVAGTFLGLVWLGIGMVAAWHTARHAPPADAPWGQLLSEMLARCGVRRPIAVRQCPQVSVPMTWGLRRPVILVPAGSAAWPAEIKRSVLLHELGHIRRGDCLTLLLGRLAGVAYWFHPLVWLAARQLRKTSEEAADDVVLAANIAPPDYAEHLVGIAAQMRGLHLFGHVALPMASPSDLEGRVLAILDSRRNHRSLKRKTCYALMTVAALFVFPCAVLRLGYAENRKPEEPTAESRNAPAKGEQAAEKRPSLQPDDRKTQRELEVKVAKAKYDVAWEKAEDEIHIRYAIKAAAVASAEYDISKAANERTPGAVPAEQLAELLLRCKGYDLAIEKARFEQRIAREEAKVAKAELEKAKFPDDRQTQREQEVAEAEAKYNLAKAKAEDDINVRHATAAAEVAKAEYEISKKANNVVPGAVPQARLNELLLKSKEADVAIEKARRDQRFAADEAKVAKTKLEAAKRKAATEHSAPAAPGEKSGSGPAKAGTTNAETPPALLTAFGTVLDPAGKPVAGATVYLREWSTYRLSSDVYNKNVNDILATTQTDAQGAFRFENVPAKPLSDQWLKEIPWDVVVAVKPYAIAWQHLYTAQRSQPFVIRLAPEAKITGRVTDPQGRPVRDAELEVYFITYLAGKWRGPFTDPDTLDLQASRLAPTAKTDADGRITIAGLPREMMLTLILKHDVFPRKHLYVATTDEPQPNVVESKHIDGKLTVEAEEVFSAAFATTLEPPLPRLIGRVTAADSKRPLPQSVVTPNNRIGEMTDREGRFILRDIRESRCRLFVFGPNSDYLSRALVIDMPKEKMEVPVEVELVRGETLSGIVAEAETGKGVAGVTVTFDTGVDVENSATEGQIPRGDRTDRAGRFRLVVPAGKGKVRITGPVPGYDPPCSGHLLEDRKEDVEGFFKEVEVVAGKPNAGLKFTVHRGNPTIGPKHASRLVEGRVVDPDGKPVAGAEVGPDLWFHDIGLRAPTETDRDGRFSFRELLTMLPHERIVAIHKSRRLRGHAPLPDISQDETKKTPLEIRLVPTGVVRGRVRQGDEPIIGAQVSLVESGPGEGNQSITTNWDWVRSDENGRFEFALVEAGKKFELAVYMEGFTEPGEREGRLEVAAGRTLEVKPLSLIRPEKSVAGSVVDPDDKPVAGVSVSADMRSGGQIPDAVTERPTGRDGRFSIRGVPNVPLMLTAYIRPPQDSQDRTIQRSAHVEAEPGQTDVRIVLDPKLMRGKK